MEKASRVIKNMKVFKSKNLDRAASAALVCHHAKDVFSDLFGKDFCKNVEVISFKENTLYVKTGNAVYSQEIKMKQTEITSRVKEKGDFVINKISFK